MLNRILTTVAIAYLLASSSLFIVRENERGVLLEFGKLVKTDIQPGWYYKIPVVNEVLKFDTRILTVDAEPERFLTLEKKAMIVDSYAKWRIMDVATYYTATSGDEERAARVIAQRINEGLRNQFGVRTLHEVVSGKRDELMHELTHYLNSIMQKELGIEVIDVRVKRIDLPEEVSGDVYNRMNSERAREASKHRSEGKELAEGLRAQADRQKTIIEAEAYRESERIRGEGDAEAAAIYAAAYSKDPEFYAFMRSLQAYKASFANRGDVLVVDPQSDFFKYLKSADGKKAQ